MNDFFKIYKVYMLRCKDGSLYTGQTDCFSRRYCEHIEKQDGAKYTRRGITELVYVSFHPNRSQALREELRLKSLNKKKRRTDRKMSQLTPKYIG